MKTHSPNHCNHYLKISMTEIWVGLLIRDLILLIAKCHESAALLCDNVIHYNGDVNYDAKSVYNHSLTSATSEIHESGTNVWCQGCIITAWSQTWNTWHVESSCILQPPKYLLLFVDRLRGINNNVTKDRCSIPMDTTVRLGALKFSLRTTINHHGPSIHSGHYTASINCCKKHSLATITQLRSLELLTAKTPLLHMLYYMNWLTNDFWTRTGGWEFDRSHGAGTSSPSHWQQVGEQAPKPLGWMMCFLLITFVPVQKLCVNRYIHMLFYMSSVFFGLPILSCSLMIMDWYQDACDFCICFKQHFDTRFLVF